MLIVGYKLGADFNKATVSISKNLSLTLHEARNILDRVENGESVSLENDFVLREDLVEYKFLVT